jgi:hypothetical protein
MVLPYLKGFLYIIVTLLLWMNLDIYCQGFISYACSQQLVSKLFLGPKEENCFRVFEGKKEDGFVQVNL